MPGIAVPGAASNQLNKGVDYAKHYGWTHEDAVVVVMGRNDSGKSYFVQRATGDASRMADSPPSSRTYLFTEDYH
jgi:hypothetical protein